ncbi:MAG: hypothetical protein IJZ07_07030 [Clostridia bacterium]|nr:hypothetical protein [Clostridia bacterium]
MADYKIINPYAEVNDLIKNSDNHYKTNLHTHSTYSDANYTMTEMIEGFYDNDFDILAFAEHGIFGKEWDKEPSKIPLFTFQYLWHGKRSHPTTEQYKAFLNGTYRTPANTRTKKRGLMCVPDAIEMNMFTLVKNHVNGYFTNDAYEGVYGKENDFETPIKLVEESGGVSHINHPTDWLQAYKDPSVAKVPENIAFFADLLRRYKSCLGIEVLNMYDRPNRSDRILWDELLKTLIPEGERTVWGFGNSDAHRVCEIDTAFMDFILPEYSLENLRKAMENGNFFAVARYAKNELGEDFKGEGAVPVVTEITVDDDADTITIKGKNCNAIEWIADGEIIESVTSEADGELVSTVKLREKSDKISCYVRAQLKGRGGICMTQPFICDDGNMARFIKPAPVPKKLTKAQQIKKKFADTRPGVILFRMIMGDKTNV